MTQKKAFTMIELVMVIVVMGIVASIGADIISNLYQNYIKTRSIARLQSQTELVLDQITKRLQYRIKESLIARDGTKAATPAPYYVTLPNANDNYKIMEWIGKSNESFLGEHNGTRVVPGWSGFIDLDSDDTNRTTGTLKTNGSNLVFASNIINSLSYGSVDLNGTNGNQRPAIIFKGKDLFDISQYGWDGIDSNYTHNATMNTNEILDINGTNLPDTIYEQYDLAWSAYALVPEGTSSDFNLTLHYNYQPWYNEKYDDNKTINPNIEKIVLIEHVSTFRFTQIGETIRLKLCINDDNRSGDYNFAFCKEKVVF
ncbi:prepilin-type N-terminal cleavage/methylation domain-containing protein [Sulfurospirillum sp.]|nr:prepilin-type N-terminal cleavage/methylation domain-containing protein [Sulfurospirillum sp.]